MRAIIFANGVVEDVAWVHELVQDDDYLIGADGGTYHCLNVGRIPHTVVGDLDSLDPSTRKQLLDQGVHIGKYPTEKDQTDLELALEEAVKHQASEIILVGALGGRLDQMLANLLLLAQRDWKARVTLIDDRQTAQQIRAGETLRLCGQVGDIVSAIPISAVVTGVSYTGLRYPLEKATLTLGSTWGVSNELVNENATVHIETGILLIVMIRR